jgi:hypothetical protein
MVNLSPSQRMVMPFPAPVARPGFANANSAPGPMPQSQVPLSGFTANTIQQSATDQALISQALNLLGNIRNLPEDEAHMRGLGIHVIFKNGQEALQLIKSKNIKVEFGDMGDSPAHAQWIADKKLIMINQRYRGDASPATLYAISEAIYHEAGHASKMTTDPATGQRQNFSVTSTNPNDIGDDQSSIQEELNCLALNTLAHRFHIAQDPGYAQSVSSSRLLSDGVALYTRLFFDPDPNKQALINRVVEKYGDLPLSSPGHEAPPKFATPWPLAHRVFAQANSSKLTMNPTQPSSPFVLPSSPAINNPLAQPTLVTPVR